MFILGISGKRGAGKDLLATTLNYYGFKNYPFANALKERVRQDLNLTKEQTDGAKKESATKYLKGEAYWTPREIMIAYGQFYRQFDSMFWVKQVFDKIKALPDSSMVTISDVRFLNEAEYIKKEGGKLIRLERNPALNIYKGSIDDPSEVELDNYKGFDWVIPAEKNETPQDLQRVADNLLDSIRKEARAAKTL